MTAEPQGQREDWRPVPGYEGLYEVSRDGDVRSIPRPSTAGGLLKPGRTKKGYRHVALCKDGRQKTWKVATLVAAAFIGPRPAGLDVCHNDGDSGNDCAGNLRYDARGGNIADQVTHGTHNKSSVDACGKCGGPLAWVPSEGRRRCIPCSKERGNSRSKSYYQRNREAILLKKYPGRVNGSGCKPGCTCGRHRGGRRAEANEDETPERSLPGT
jgi:NUMOD4 motif